MSATAQHPGLMTPAEVAAAFRVDPRTVTRWAKAGKLSAIRTLGGHRRYRESEVRGLLEGGGAERWQVRYWSPGGVGLPAVYGNYTSRRDAEAALAMVIADGFDRPFLARQTPGSDRWERVSTDA